MSSMDVDFAATRTCTAAISAEIQPEKLWELFSEMLSRRKLSNFHRYEFVTNDDVRRELDSLFLAAEQSATTLQEAFLIFEKKYQLLLAEGRKFTNELRHLPASI